MNRRIGSCSICGGNVMAFEGPWASTMPPPPPECDLCHAVEAGCNNVIQMIPKYIPSHPASAQPWQFTNAVTPDARRHFPLPEGFQSEVK